MLEGSYMTTNPLGLHARAAANVTRLAEKFQSDITFHANGSSANAKSLLGLLTLAAARGVTIRVVVTGADERAALEAMAALIQDNFGEKPKD